MIGSDNDLTEYFFQIFISGFKISSMLSLLASNVQLCAKYYFYAH